MFFGKIAATIISAKGLKEPESVRLDGVNEVQINPYVVMEIGGEEVDKTSIKYAANKPFWGEKLYSPDVVSAETVRFFIKHSSDVDDLHDLIGECSLSIPYLLDGSENIKTLLTLEEKLSPQGTLKVKIMFERRVNYHNITRRKAMRKNRIHYHRGHAFKVHNYRAPAICAHCKGLLIGFMHQGYKCNNCLMSVHKQHYKKVINACGGVNQQKNRDERPKVHLELNIPHRLHDHCFVMAQCDHCGEIISLWEKAVKCRECKKKFHASHRDMLPTDCGNNKEMLDQLNAHLDHLGPTTADPVDIDVSDEEEKEEDLESDLFRRMIRESDAFITAKNKPVLDDFDLINVLGHGAYGKVFKVKHVVTGKVYALKAINKDMLLETDEIGTVALEKSILSLATKNNFLTQLHSTFQTLQHIFFVMEFISGGDLFFHMMNLKVFPEANARFYAAEIAVAIIFLHSQGILHRDLKLDNVLLDTQGHIKVADFGMSKAGILDGKKTNTLCGTPDYIAPEVLNEEWYGISCDWWSYGVMLFEMLSGRAPFMGKDDKTRFHHIKTVDPVYPKLLGKEARSLLEKLLEKKVDRRLASQDGREEEIYAQPFFEEIDWDKLRNRQISPPFIPSDRLNVDYEFKQATPQLSLTEESFISTGRYDNTFKGFDYYNQNYSA